MKWTSQQVTKKDKASSEEIKAVERWLTRNGAEIKKDGIIHYIKMRMPGIKSLGAIDFLTNYCRSSKRIYIWVRE